MEAYRELEEAGVAERRQGAGTFLRGLTESKRAVEHLRVARRPVRRLLHDASVLRVTWEDLERALRTELRGRVP